MKEEKERTFKDLIRAVEEFHQVHGIHISEGPTARSLDDALSRYRLMREENEEYLDAARSKDMTAVADALGDQLYVLCGTIIEHGLQDHMIAIFEEIHASNMSKCNEEGDVVRDEHGKVIKGPNYFKPNIASIIKHDK